MSGLPQDEIATIVLVHPKNPDQAPEDDDPYQLVVDITNIECDYFQSKGGMDKINKNTKQIKDIQKMLASKIQKQNFFNTPFIQISNGTLKKLYLVMYNAMYYSYNQYYIFIKIERNPKFFEECCDITLQLHQKLMVEESVDKIKDNKNSLNLMNYMKDILLNMKKVNDDMQEHNDDGILQSKKLEDYFDRKKDFPYLNGYQEYYSQQIKKIKIQTLIIDLIRFLIQVIDFVKANAERDISIFEERILMFIQKFNPHYTSQDQNIFFDYFREIINFDTILDRFKLLKLQINSQLSILKSLKMCDSLVLQNDGELTNMQSNQLNKKLNHDTSDVVCLANIDNQNTNNRNQQTFNLSNKKVS